MSIAILRGPKAHRIIWCTQNELSIKTYRMAARLPNSKMSKWGDLKLYFSLNFDWMGESPMTQGPHDASNSLQPNGSISSRHSYLKAASESFELRLHDILQLCRYMYICIRTSTSTYDTANESFSVVHTYAYVFVYPYVHTKYVKNAPERDMRI